MASVFFLALVLTASGLMIGSFIKNTIWSGKAQTPIEHARAWAAYTAFIVTVSSVHLFVKKDIVDAIASFVVSLIFFTLFALAIGFLYGLIKNNLSTLNEEPDSIPNNSDIVKPSCMTQNNSIQKALSPNSIDEENLWAQAMNEYDSPSRNQGLWAKLFVQFEGEETKIKVAYVKTTAEKLIAAAKEIKKMEEMKRVDLPDSNNSALLGTNKLDSSDAFLVHAVKTGSFSIAAQMLKDGASPFLLENGKSLLDFAQENNDTAMVNMLKNYIAKHEKSQSSI
jgi:hypothetical protein